MYKCMSRGSSFYFSQAHEISSLEVAVPVLELPHCHFRIAGMESIAYFVKAIHVELSDEGGDVGVLEILRENL